ncbi:MAG: hydratase [Proteobacteria bacterium]|nr:hydratase [Pseudomonadota bacterium]
MNAVLYGPRGKRWAMTERGASALSRDEDFIRIGGSGMSWEDGRLSISIDEVTVPFPTRLRGLIVLHPSALGRASYALDPAGRHRWMPLAPSARAEVSFDSPSLRWSGNAYFDTNAGAAPLESDFLHWSWSRQQDSEGTTTVLYDVACRDGTARGLALRYDPSGEVSHIAPPPWRTLRRTLWGLGRATRGDGGVRVERTLEDTPFYARSVLATDRGPAVHEMLSLNRFRAPLVQAMLSFRMPRRG